MKPSSGTKPLHQISLGYRPRAWQRECHSRRKRFTVLALHRRAGKTVLAVMELIDHALQCGRAQGIYVYLAPFLKQAKAIAWNVLKARVEPLRRVGACEVLEGELTVLFRHNGAAIRLFGADNPDALRGMGLEGVVIDEVAQVKPEVWREILQPALADRLGWALFIGTPKGINLFSELFYAAAAGKDDWFAGLWTVYQTDALDPREVERQRREMMDSGAENAWAREYLCDFAAAADDQLLSLTDVTTASQRVYTEKDIMHAPRILGVDPARFGDDRSVIVKRQGLQMFDAIVMRGIDNMALAARVAHVWQEWKPHAVFIDHGQGSGVIDRLRQLDYDPIEVPFGGKATAPNLFVNKRTEMWWEMRDWIVGGGAIPAKDMVLRQELATPIYWFDAQGRKVLEPKEDIKERLLGAGSPDIADALALTFAHPVAAPRLEDRALKAQRGERRDYDPFADGRVRG